MRLAHASDRLTSEDLNPALLMWRMRVDISELPEHRVVIRFEFSGVSRTNGAYATEALAAACGLTICTRYICRVSH